MAQISGSRSIKSVELASPTTVRVLIETTLENNSSEILNDVEFINPFLETVEIPSAAEVIIKLRGDLVSHENVEFKTDRSEDVPNYNLFRILLRNLNDTVGGLQPGEEISIMFAVYKSLELEDAMLKFPTLINALVNPDTLLIEEVASDAPILQSQVLRGMQNASSGRTAGITFENKVIDKFANLAVEAYNAQKYEDALLYCNEILSVAQTGGDQALIQNFTNISTKLITIIEKSSKEKLESAYTTPIDAASGAGEGFENRTPDSGEEQQKISSEKNGDSDQDAPSNSEDN